jgi:hypothetical protein
MEQQKGEQINLKENGRTCSFWPELEMEEGRHWKTAGGWALAEDGERRWGTSSAPEE